MQDNSKKKKNPFEKLLKPTEDSELKKLGKPLPKKPEPSIYEQALGLEPETSFIPKQAAEARRAKEAAAEERLKQAARQQRIFTFEPPTERDAYEAEGFGPPASKSLGRQITERIVDRPLDPAQDPNRRFSMARQRSQELPMDFLDSDVFRPYTGDQTKLARNPWKHLDETELAQLEDPNFRAELTRVAAKPALTRTKEENRLVSRFILPGLDPMVQPLPLERYQRAKDQQKALSRVSRGAKFARGLYGEAYGGPEITEASGYLDSDYLSWKLGQGIHTVLGGTEVDPLTLLSAPFQQERVEDKEFVAEAYNRIVGSLSGFVDDSMLGLMTLSPEARRDPLVFEALRQDQELTRQRYMSDPDKQGFGWDILSGAASTIPFLVGGAVMGMAGAAGIAPVLLGAAQSAGSSYNDAIASGATHEQALRAGHVGLAIGMLEGIGLEGNLAKFGMGQAITSGLRDVAEEFGQEGVTQWLNNLNAKLITGYDPDRALMEGVAEAGVIGGLLGGVMAAPGTLRQIAETGEAYARFDRETEILRAQRTLAFLKDVINAPLTTWTKAVEDGRIQTLPADLGDIRRMAALTPPSWPSQFPYAQAVKQIDLALLSLQPSTVWAVDSATAKTLQTTKIEDLHDQAVEAIAQFARSPEYTDLVKELREGRTPNTVNPETQETLKKIYEFYRTFSLVSEEQPGVTSRSGYGKLLSETAESEHDRIVAEYSPSNYNLFYQPAAANPGVFVFASDRANLKWATLFNLAPILRLFSPTAPISSLEPAVSAVPNVATGQGSLGYATRFDNYIQSVEDLSRTGLIPTKIRDAFRSYALRAAQYNVPAIGFVLADKKDAAGTSQHEMVHVGQSWGQLSDAFKEVRKYLDPAVRPTLQTPDPVYDQYAEYLKSENFKDFLRFTYHSLSSYWSGAGRGLDTLFPGATAAGLVTRNAAEAVASGQTPVDTDILATTTDVPLLKKLLTIFEEVQAFYFSNTWTTDIGLGGTKGIYGITGGLDQLNKYDHPSMYSLYGDPKTPGIGADEAEQLKAKERIEEFLIATLNLYLHLKTSEVQPQEQFLVFINVNRSNQVFERIMNSQTAPDGTVTPGLLAKLSDFIDQNNLPRPAVLANRPTTLDEVQKPKPASMLDWLNRVSPDLTIGDSLTYGSILQPSRNSDYILNYPTTPEDGIASLFGLAGIKFKDGSSVTRAIVVNGVTVAGDTIDFMLLAEKLGEIAEQLEGLATPGASPVSPSALSELDAKLEKILEMSEMVSRYHRRYTDRLASYYYSKPLPWVATQLRTLIADMTVEPKAAEVFFDKGASSPDVMGWYNPESWKPFGVTADVLDRYKTYTNLVVDIYEMPTDSRYSSQPVKISRVGNKVTLEIEYYNILGLPMVDRPTRRTGKLELDTTVYIDKDSKVALGVTFPTELIDQWANDPDKSTFTVTKTQAAIHRLAQQLGVDVVDYFVGAEMIPVERQLVQPLPDPTKRGWIVLDNRPYPQRRADDSFNRSSEDNGSLSDRVKDVYDAIRAGQEYGETTIGSLEGNKRNPGALVQAIGKSLGIALGKQVKDPSQPEVERQVRELSEQAGQLIAQAAGMIKKNKNGVMAMPKAKAGEVLDKVDDMLGGLRNLTNLDSFEARLLEDHLIPMIEDIKHTAQVSMSKGEMKGTRVANEEAAFDTSAPAPADSLFGTIMSVYTDISEQAGANPAKMQEFAEYLAGREDLDEILTGMGISVESTGDPLSDLEDAIGQAVVKFFDGWTPAEKAGVIATAVNQDSTSIIPSGRNKKGKKKARAKADQQKNNELDEITNTIDPGSIVDEEVDVAESRAVQGTLYNLEDLLRREREAKETAARRGMVLDDPISAMPMPGFTAEEAEYLRYARRGFTEVYPGVFQEPDGTYRLVSSAPGARRYVQAKTLEARRPTYLTTEQLFKDHPESVKALVAIVEAKNKDREYVANLLATLYASDPKRFGRTYGPIFGLEPWAVEAIRDFGVVTQNYGLGRKTTLTFTNKQGPEKGKVNNRRFFDWAAEQVIGQITWTEEELITSESGKFIGLKNIFQIESEDFVNKLGHQAYPDYRLIEPADEKRVPYLILPQNAIDALEWIQAYVTKLEEVQRPLTVEEIGEIATTTTTRGLSIPLSFLWEAQRRERSVMKAYDPGPNVTISPFRTFIQLLPEALKLSLPDYKYLTDVLHLLADSAIKRGYERLTLVSNSSEATTSIEDRVRHESFHTVQDLLSRGADPSVMTDVMKDAMKQAALIAGTVSSLHTSALRSNPLVQKAMRSMLGAAILARTSEMDGVREDIFISEMVPYILEGRFIGLTPEEQVEVVVAYFEDIIANQPDDMREQARAVLRLAVEYPKMFSEALAGILEARERIENAQLENIPITPAPETDQTDSIGPPSDERGDVAVSGGGGGIEGTVTTPGSVEESDAGRGDTGNVPPSRPPVSPPPPPFPAGAPKPNNPITTHIISLEALRATVEEMVQATSKGSWTWDPDLPTFQNIGAAIRAGALDLAALATKLGVGEELLVADLADLVEGSETLAGQQLQVLSELQKAYEFLFNQLVFPPSQPVATPTPGAATTPASGAPTTGPTGPGTGSAQTGGTVRPGTTPSRTGIAQAQQLLPAIVLTKQLMRILNSSTLNYTLPTRLTMLMKKNMLSVFQTASVQFVTTGLRSGIEIARGAIRGAILGGISRPGDFGLQSPNWFRRTFDSILMSVQPSILLALNFAPNIGKFKARDAIFNSISAKLGLVDPLILIDALRSAHPKVIGKLEGEIRDWNGSDYDVLIIALEQSAAAVAAGTPITKSKSQIELANKAIERVQNFRKRRKFNESILGKIIKADETILDKIFLRPLTWQEYTFRQPMFVGALTEGLARRGIDLRTMYLNNMLERLDQKYLEEAMREATFFTMAQDPETEKDLLGKVAAKSISAINALGPLSLVVSAFPRVIYNAIKFTWEYSPLGMLGLMASPQVRVRFRPSKKVDPTTGQFVVTRQTPNDIRFIADRLAKGLTGTMLYAIASSLSDDDLIGEEWWQIKAGKDAKGNQTYVDARNLFPFTPFLFFAVWLRRFQEGNVGDQSLAKDIKEMFFGFQRQASEVGDQFFFDLFDSFAAMVSGGEDPAKETGDMLTRLGSVPLTPLVNFRYLVSIFNEEERVRMDPALAGRLAPFIDKVPGKYIWGERFGVHPLHGRTIGDFVKMYESPLGWAMGLKTGQDSFIGQEAAKFGIDLFKILPKDPIPYINHFKTQQFGSLVGSISEELAKDSFYLKASQDDRKIIIDNILRQAAKDVNEFARDRFAGEVNLRSQRSELGPIKSKATGFEGIYREELKKLKEAINLNEFECGIRKRPPFSVYQPKSTPTPQPTPSPDAVEPEVNLEELLNENEQ